MSRLSQADETFLLYDFEEEVRGGPWQHLEGSDEWNRTLTFNNDTKRIFVVKFYADSEDIYDAYVL